MAGLDLKVRGVTFDGRQEKLESLYNCIKNGEKIVTELKPDPKNKFDKNAIKVIVNGFHIGFIQKKLAKQMKEKLNTGQYVYHAILSEITPGDEEIAWGAKIKLFRKKLKK